MEDEMCFHCLRNLIRSDFSDSDDLLFSYGIFSSPLPFGHRAVVKVPNSNGEGSTELLLVYLPTDPDDCIANYIDEHLSEDGGKGIEIQVTDKLDMIEQQKTISRTLRSNVLSPSVQNNNKSFLNGSRKILLSGLYSVDYLCTPSSHLCCFRSITAIAPNAHIGLCSYKILGDLASSLFSGSMEDHILRSLALLIEGKATDHMGKNFLRLIGIPSFDDVHIPGCLRHPNLSPVLGMLKASNYSCLVFPKAPYTLENIIHFSPEALSSEWHMKFLIYQLLSALAYLHGLGLAHGSVCPSNVTLTSSSWAWLSICDKQYPVYDSTTKDDDRVVSSTIGTSCCGQNCISQGLYADMKLCSLEDWHTGFYRWWRGELSNFEYLLILNRLAGRRWGDHTFHTVMPWVIDFTMKPDENSNMGWRDLNKSKWRLAKGDEQLDFTYASSEIPHHISDECLSELAVCSYKARRLPLSVLRSAVRSVYEPNEYPSTMQRLYQWTPDECIPEFYCDPHIFYSRHSGMSDLTVPSWAASPEEFIMLHREALESSHVSREIHHWIDITFGYKMSGEAAVSAKNVMLSSSDPTLPRSMGRRQLFTRSHPARLVVATKVSNETNGASNLGKDDIRSGKAMETDYLHELEEAASFCEHAMHLSPKYCYQPETIVISRSSMEEQPNEGYKHRLAKATDSGWDYAAVHNIDCSFLLEHLGLDDTPSGYQDLLLWGQKSSIPHRASESAARDIFSLGCIVAELYMKKPLFDSVSLSMFWNDDAFPGLMKLLPPHIKFLVEACIQKDWRRRPSAKNLLDSPFFPATIKSAYLFLAPLHLLSDDGSRLCYAANFALKGALRAMGPLAAEKCASYCVPFLVNPLSDFEAEWAYIVLKEFLVCLMPKAVNELILPAVQKILQASYRATGYSHLKVSLLQDSFVREVWNHVGKQLYLEKIHPLVLSNLSMTPHKTAAAAASVLLIGSSEELGVPITIHQTILPLIYCFGKGLCTDGIDVLVRIGIVLGENFIVSQILPLLKNVIRSCVGMSFVNKPDPMQCWNSLALVDCLRTLDGLVSYLPKEVVVAELIEDKSCLFVVVLMKNNLELPVLQAAATTLIAVCQHLGPELAALHVLPKLKELFDELAFSEESLSRSGSIGKSIGNSQQNSSTEREFETRMDLVYLLYPSFASLLGIEKMRQCCTTWLLLEQYLFRHHSWKWEVTGESSRSSPENSVAKKPSRSKSAASLYNPTKLLMHGVGWSLPQSQRNRGKKNVVLQKQFYELHSYPIEGPSPMLNMGNHEPWFWFPSPAANWDGPDFMNRAGGIKDELPWKVQASVIYSVRAHHGALRSLSVDRDECTVFSAGVGPGFKGTVQKWNLSSFDCIAGYYGHEEVVNDLCVLPSSGRVASCDGTIHIWNCQTGKVISVIAESSANALPGSPVSSLQKFSSDQSSLLNSNPLSSGILTSGFDGSLYTYMQFLDYNEKLVVGTGNGSLRYIDVVNGEKLHMWKSECVEYGFPSLVSAICSCGSDKVSSDGNASSPAWIAAGLSSGVCKLLDARIGDVVASWRAHDGYVTKLAAPEDHLLISSSLDKTLRIWDLRKSLPSQPSIFRGHSDGVSDFSVWGRDVISISRNKIGLSSLSGSADEDGSDRIVSQALYTVDRGTRNMSVLSSIRILPFSRLFLVGTEDGHLKICC